MKAITVTQQNAQLVAFRLRQFFNRYECTQSYTDWGWYPKYLNKMGIKPAVGKKHIEKSNIDYALREITKVRVENDYGIIINIGKASAHSIHLGQKIKIAPNRIIVSGLDKICLKTNFTSYYFPCNDIEKAKNAIDFNEIMDKQYWEDLEQEHANNLYLEDMEQEHVNNSTIKL